MDMLCIGRFQPFHKNHFEMIKHAASKLNGGKLMIIVSSADKKEMFNNPLSAENRVGSIYQCLEAADWFGVGHENIYIKVVNESPYNWDLWVKEVQKRLIMSKFNISETVLFGHDDLTSRYAFDIGCIYEHVDELGTFHATDVRNAALTGTLEDVKEYLPAGFSDEIIEIFIKNVREAKSIQDKYASDVNMKYPTCFMAVDCLLQAGGYVAVISRGDNGKFALPGGFADPSEDLMSSSFRELKEETLIDLKQMPYEFKGSKVFDAPCRGPRASDKVNILTNLFHFKINERPTGVGSDDAVGFKWMSLAEIEMTPACKFHGDHKKMLCNVLGLNYFQC